MIKIKAKFDIDNQKLNWKYKTKNTNTIEHLTVIWNLIDIILEEQEQITEKELLDMIKNRKKFMIEMEEK